jgi:hypothetical protein
MTKAWLLIIEPSLLLIAGCAINDIGTVKVRYFENESSYLVTQEAWGGYLSTRQTDGGLTLGHTERIMVYPKQGNKSDLFLDELLQQSNNYSFDKEIEPKDINLKDMQPYAWIESNQGVTLHANSLKTGFSAGTDSRRAIRLPADFDGVLIFDSQTDGTVKAAIYETSKIE